MSHPPAPARPPYSAPTSAVRPAGPSTPLALLFIAGFGLWLLPSVLTPVLSYGLALPPATVGAVSSVSSVLGALFGALAILLLRSSTWPHRIIGAALVLGVPIMVTLIYSLVIPVVTQSALPMINVLVVVGAISHSLSALGWIVGWLIGIDATAAGWGAAVPITLIGLFIGQGSAVLLSTGVVSLGAGAPLLYALPIAWCAVEFGAFTAAAAIAAELRRRRPRPE